MCDLHNKVFFTFQILYGQLNVSKWHLHRQVMYWVTTVPWTCIPAMVFMPMKLCQLKWIEISFPYSWITAPAVAQQTQTPSWLGILILPSSGLFLKSATEQGMRTVEIVGYWVIAVISSMPIRLHQLLNHRL